MSIAQPSDIDPELADIVERQDMAALEKYQERQRQERYDAAVDRIGEVETWDELRRGLGRNDCPSLLFDWWSELGDFIDIDQLAIGIEQAWTGAEFPSRMLDPEDWETLFEQVGFIEHTTRHARPTKPIRLYRGAIPEYRDGMSWTDNLEQARWFANRFQNLEPRHVWTVEMPPRYLLAHFHHEDSRQEFEWVVSTAYVSDPSVELTIVE